MNTASLRPVVKRSAESLAVEALRSHVLSGAVPPGQRLTEINLAERLGISRATLRTALHRLTLEGLVHQIPYTGWEVASLTGHDAWELYTLRSSLEGLAARLAAEREPEVKKSVHEAFAALKRTCKTRDYAAAPLFPMPDTDLKGYLIGATVPVGPGLIRAAYSRVSYDTDAAPTALVPVPDPKAGKLSLSYVHNLSKRTALYATVARISNKNGAALTVGGPAFITTSVFAPRTSSGYDLGIRHAF